MFKKLAAAFILLAPVAAMAAGTSISGFPSGGNVQPNDLLLISRLIPNSSTYKSYNATIPYATSSVFGTVKVGDGLIIAPDGSLSAVGGSVMSWPSSAGIPYYSGNSQWGTNLSVNGVDPITVSLAGNILTTSISEANSVTDGYLSSSDWQTFNEKQNAITTGATTQYLRGDLSLGVFPTKVSSFTNDSLYLSATNNLSDLSSTASARSNLGLGSIAQQSASSVSITGGTASLTSLISSSATVSNLTSGNISNSNNITTNSLTAATSTVTNSNSNAITTNNLTATTSTVTNSNSINTNSVNLVSSTATISTLNVTTCNGCSSTKTVEDFDGGTTGFTLSYTPLSKANVDVYIYGVHQNASTFSLLTNVVTLGASAPSGTGIVEISYSH